jgi:hypothetical protein
MPGPLPTKTIEAMYAAYSEVPTQGYVARVCKVAVGTARKYIHEGAPLQGIEAFYDRRQRLLRKVHQLTDEVIAQSWAERAKGLMPLIAGAEKLTLQAIDKLDGKLKKDELTLIMVTRALGDIARVRRELWEDRPKEERPGPSTSIGEMLSGLQDALTKLNDAEKEQLFALMAGGASGEDLSETLELLLKKGQAK